MKAIEKEQILRLNCPGYGEQSYLTMGVARPLQTYSVIVINPTSILHLFNYNTELLEQVEIAQSNGLTTLSTDKENLLQPLLADLRAEDGRLVELVAFLEKGGLLIFFLCRPFLVQSPTLVMDNYYWLESLAPDTPTDNNMRHISTVSYGKNYELTKEGVNSEFAAYLNQPELEWNAAIRNIDLTEGYIPLATVGHEKSIAGELFAGENGGKIVFLPAPYYPAFDKTLIECINHWKENRTEPWTQAYYASKQSTDRQAPQQKSQIDKILFDSKMLSSPLHANSQKPINVLEAFQGQPAIPAPTNLEKRNDFQIADDVNAYMNPIAKENPLNSPKRPADFLKNLAALSNLPNAETAPNLQEEQPPTESSQENTSAKNLIKKMEMIAITLPSWCSEYSFPGLNELKHDRTSLIEQIQEIQATISSLDTKIKTLDEVKNSLLGHEGEELLNACSKVFQRLNWNSKRSDNNKEELWLSENAKTDVIVHVIRTNSQPKNSDLAGLVQSVVSYWGEHEAEPKGLMVACTWADSPPAERNEPDFSQSLIEFAQKKNLCLMSVMQLICLYRDIELGNTTPEEIRNQLLNTSGLLKGFTFEEAVSNTKAR